MSNNIIFDTTLIIFEIKMFLSFQRNKCNAFQLSAKHEYYFIFAYHGSLEFMRT